MANKPQSPPSKSFTRTVQLWTPGGFTVQIREEDFVNGFNSLTDEDLALAYSEATGLRVTVETVYQTTTGPYDPKYEEVVNG